MVLPDLERFCCRYLCCTLLYRLGNLFLYSSPPFPLETAVWHLILQYVNGYYISSRRKPALLLEILVSYGANLADLWDISSTFDEENLTCVRVPCTGTNACLLWSTPARDWEELSISFPNTFSRPDSSLSQGGAGSISLPLDSSWLWEWVATALSTPALECGEHRGISPWPELSPCFCTGRGCGCRLKHMYAPSLARISSAENLPEIFPRKSPKEL